jgi:precorrin-8X/cobalt-precorrin-8 methylmutase
MILKILPPEASCGSHMHKGGQMRPYEKNPSAIYAESFATVRREARLDRFDAGMERMAIRLIHACGMVEVADRLAFSENAYAAGHAALQAGKPILCDCEMVGAGIIRRYLPAENEVIVTLNDARTPGIAAGIGNTRSAAAVELWADHLDGAVVAVGNAPTALFHLLELIDQGAPKPAVILGFPVGFVGAAESKAELAANPRGCDFVALRGRRGGSAIASAAVNALAAGLPEEQAEATR